MYGNEKGELQSKSRNRSCGVCPGGSTLPGNVCINAPATVQAEEGTGAESASQQVINLNTSWKYLDNNTDPAAGLGSLTAWTAAGFDDSSWKEAAGSFGAKRGELTEFDGYTPTVLLQQYIEGTTTDVPTFSSEQNST